MFETKCVASIFKILIKKCETIQKEYHIDRASIWTSAFSMLPVKRTNIVLYQSSRLLNTIAPS